MSFAKPENGMTLAYKCSAIILYKRLNTINNSRRR